MVKLEGTWSRTNTTPSEVYIYRRSMRHAVRAVGGTFDARMPRGQSDALRTGTFKVTIPVGRYGGDTPYRYARALLTAMMLGRMCRPPKIKLDASRCDFWINWGEGEAVNL